MLGPVASEQNSIVCTTGTASFYGRRLDSMPTSQEDDFGLTPTPTELKKHTHKDAERLFRATWTPVTVYFTHENPYSTVFR